MNASTRQPVRSDEARVGPAARLAGATVLAVASAAVLLARAQVLVAEASAVLRSGAGARGLLAVTPVEDLVEGAAVLLGLVIAGWLAVALAVATACACARVLGGRWRLGEQIVVRTAPAMVRRAVALSAGTGIALAATGMPASAGVAPPPVDLGWSPTATAEPWPTPLPSGADGATRVEVGTPAAGATSPQAGGAERAAGAVTGGGAEATEAETEGARTSAEPSAPSAPSSIEPAAPTAGGSGGAEPGATAVDEPAAPPAPVSGSSPPPVPPSASPSGPLAPARQPTPAPSSAPRPSAAAASAPVVTPAPLAAATTAAPATVSAAAASQAPGVVTVQPGDTLWGIASDSLPAGATAADVAAAWPRWFEANADVVGADPDLIRPGQRLLAPAGVVDAARAGGAAS